ncbi:MAG: hypothetical protein MZV65_46510 [Chromatiales bacterium]|nr:hypothetical protein [Chromatiales bacterium]
MTRVQAGLPAYDIQMPRVERWRFHVRAFRKRRQIDPGAHWRSAPADFAGFRRFVRDQVYVYSPAYFDHVDLEIDEETRRHITRGGRLVYSFIHHGFFPLIAFVVHRKFAQPCTTIGTAPSRNLAEQVNPDHLFWKYAFYFQARRWLGTRFIFSDEPPRLILDWLKNVGSLTAAIDVIEEGVVRKNRTAIIDGRRLGLPETVTRLARLSGVPIVAASLYKDGDDIRLKLGPPHFVTSADAADAVFQRLASELFEPYLRFPEQRFFDLLDTFALHE